MTDILLTHTEQQRPERTKGGRFAKGNTISRKGGQARAAALTPAQRQTIARSGWTAFVRRHFAGDETAARAWWGALGAWVYDQQVGAGSPYIFRVYPHPGAPTDYRARRYQLDLFLAFTLEEVPPLAF